MIDGILFDLYGTLIPSGTKESRDELSRKMAGILEVDPDGFAEAIVDSYDDRMTGRLGSLAETILCLAQGIGGSPSRAAIEKAIEMRLDLTRSLLEDTWALDVLDQFHKAHIPIGVISDCSAEVPDVWEDTALAKLVDAAAFSCKVGICKPDPRIYWEAIRQLNVDPLRCAYVGDGFNDELYGARNVGMRAILVESDSPRRDPSWGGERVGTLEALAELLELA